VSEKTFDGAEILGRISGLGREETMRIWEEVKENQAKLNACVRPHDFQQDDPKSIRSRWTCRLCDGKVSSREARWYILGLEDAGQ